MLGKASEGNAMFPALQRFFEAVGCRTQQQLAEAIGVSRQTINAIESGKYVPSTLLSLKISEIFGKTVNEIFMLEESDR